MTEIDRIKTAEELLVSERQDAVEQLNRRLTKLIKDLEQLKQKTDWAIKHNGRIRITTYHINSFEQDMQEIQRCVVNIEKVAYALQILQTLREEYTLDI